MSSPGTTIAGEDQLAQGQLVRRPQRWDDNFGRARIHDDWVDLIVSSEVFSDVDPSGFPDDLSFADIIANDCSVKWYSRGEVVYEEGSHQTSLFIVLNGSVRLADAAGPERRSWPQLTSHLDTWLRGKDKNSVSNVTRFPTVRVGRYEMFGELEAMTRAPRGNTAFAEVDRTALLEITWPGAREMLHWSDAFRLRVENLYRARSIEAALKESGLLAETDAATFAAIVRVCSFERHGGYDWSYLYQREKASEQRPGKVLEREPLIVEQGNYLEDGFLVRSGFARVTQNNHDNEFTAGFLEKGGVFGFAEIEESSQAGGHPHAGYGLRAVGYTELIRIPEHIVVRYMLSGTREDRMGTTYSRSRRPDADLALLDFVVDNRFINATNAMVIDTTRCVGCDDCVRACAAAHDGVPRFVRTGKAHANLMVANACMHCTDPVCLIDCPTGAIRRDATSGSVVIDDETCIGCSTCSSACPYNNIRMLEMRNPQGAVLMDEDGAALLKASKCDLCAGHSSGPACQRACPHDALTRIDIREINPSSCRQPYV